MTIVETDIDIKLLREFMQNVLDCEYGISDSLNQELSQYSKTISELTEKEVEALSSKVFSHPPIFCLYNLKDAIGNLLLPNIYNDFLNRSENKELFSIGKYGIQCIDLFNNKGKLLYKDAFWIDFHTDYYIEIMEQSSKIKIFRYRPETEDIEFLAEPIGNILGRLISFEESRFYFNNGFVDENFLPTTPMCFDNGKYFNDLLAPVCFNGKWGYINKKSEVVIDFIYGDAEPFMNGSARVFVLHSDFLNEKGVWMDVHLDEGYTQKQFLELFSQFPTKRRKPLCFLRNNYKTVEELNDEYHYYGEGVKDSYGYWAEINTKGEIISVIHNNHTNQIEDSTHRIIDSTIDKEYWLNYTIENLNNYSIASKLPDVLFVDRNFIIKILTCSPDLFSQFSVLYGDDLTICELVFNLSFENFDFFSARIKKYFEERYNQKMIEENNVVVENNIDTNGLDDDLPF
jgi:hypothetical protein